MFYTTPVMFELVFIPKRAFGVGALLGRSGCEGLRVAMRKPGVMTHSLTEHVEIRHGPSGRITIVTTIGVQHIASRARPWNGLRAIAPAQGLNTFPNPAHNLPAWNKGVARQSRRF